MRILIAHSFYRVAGGEDSYVRRQIDLLAREHEVSLIEGRNEELGSGLRTAGRMLFSSMKKEEVETRIRDFAPDVIHVHNVYPSLGPAVHLAAESLGVPLVQTIHNYRMRCPNGYMFTEGRVCSRCEAGNYANAIVHRCFPERKQATAYASVLWAHRFVLRLERRVTAFVTPSRFVRDRLLDWGIDEDRVRAIPHFVTPVPDASSTPGDHGIYVGRLSSEKGVDVLLKALRSTSDPPFTIVGDGPLEPELRALAHDLDLKNVTFTGRLTGEELVARLSRSRFVVIPSLVHETGGLVALEAMSFGRPLLVSQRGVLTELVATGAGLSCEAGDADAMSSAIDQLMETDDLCIRMGAKGIELSLSEFHPDRHRDRLVNVYEHATATQRRMVGGERKSR